MALNVCRCAFNPLFNLPSNLFISCILMTYCSAELAMSLINSINQSLFPAHYYCNLYPFQKKPCHIPCNTPQQTPNWGAWGTWTRCSVTCQAGQRSRTRLCLGTSGSERNCSGDVTEREPCTLPPCPTPPVFPAEWGPWFPCSVTCGTGSTLRMRQCHSLNQTHGRQGVNDTSCQLVELQDRTCKRTTCSIGG